MKRLLLLAVLLAPALVAQTNSVDPVRPENERAAWLYFDAPAWDISNEGLPFRLTLAVPGSRDIITRWLHASSAQWTAGIGYAKVYNSYDDATGVFKNPGGHAALFSVGRQMRWTLPPFAGRFTPAIAMEYGVQLATRPLPADGTRANLLLITGLDWRWPGPGEDGWSVGICWPHFSNANLLSRNAGYDGLSVRVGRSIRF